MHGVARVGQEIFFIFKVGRYSIAELYLLIGGDVCTSQLGLFYLTKPQTLGTPLTSTHKNEGLGTLEGQDMKTAVFLNKSNLDSLCR